MKKIRNRILTFVLAVVMALGMGVTSLPAMAAEVDLPEVSLMEETVPAVIDFAGDEVGFFKEDGVSSFGMLSLQDGSKYVVDGDTVEIYDVPRNKTVYDGIHWGLITDADLTKDVLRLDSGCWQISVSTEDCGHGIAVAPVKQKDGKTTDSQYYLCIPVLDKIPVKADYSAVDAALEAVPEDLDVYTEESVKALEDVLKKTDADDFDYYSVAEQETVDAVAKAINDAVAALEIAPAASELEDGVYTLPDLAAGPSAMFNHFVADSKMLIVSGDTATVRFITDGSTASIQKYSKIALGKSSELVSTDYQANLAEGTTIIEGVLQPYSAGNIDKYLFEITMSKAEVEALLVNDVVEDIYLTIWNKEGSKEEIIPGWYKASKDIYLSLGSLGEKTETPAATPESFGFSLQVGQYTEGADFHTASFQDVVYELKDQNGNLYTASSISDGMIHYSNLSADNTYTFTATREGWAVVTQGEWDTEAHAYIYTYTGANEINITITKEDAGKNISEYTNPGMVFRLAPREENEVDKALAAVPEKLNYDLFTDESANALKDAIAAANPEETDNEKLAAMAAAVTTALRSLMPKDGSYEVSYKNFNGAPAYIYDGARQTDLTAIKGKLIVENGKMIADLVIRCSGTYLAYDYAFVGTKEEAMSAASADQSIALTYAEKDYEGDGKNDGLVQLPVAALATELNYAFHSGSAANAGQLEKAWYDQKLLFDPGSLVDLAEEANKPIELAITNNTSMFKAVSAFLEKADNQTTLVVALSGSGYKELYKGTYEAAVANDANTDNWIHGATNAEGKLEFRIPVEEGETFIPLVAISNSYYTKYLDGQNSLARAFFPRQIVLDVEEKTIVTGDYEYAQELAITNNVKMFTVANAILETVGGPNSNNYKADLVLTMGSDSFDKAFVGTAEEAAAAETTLAITDRVLNIPVKWLATFGQPETMQTLLGKSFTVAYHSVKNDNWVERSVTINEEKGTILFNSVEVDAAADEALAKVPEDLTGYTEESAAAVSAAVEAVEAARAAGDQEAIAKAAQDLDTAIANLAVPKKDSTITVKAKSATYNGKAVASNKAVVTGSTGEVTYKYYSDAKCTKEVKAADVKAAKTYYVIATVAADDNFKAATSAPVKLTIKKAKNPMTVKAAKKVQTVKAKKVKSKKQTTKKSAFKFTKKAQGKVTYKVVGGKAKAKKALKVNKKGQIIVKKGTKKGTYKIKVQVKAKGNKNYKSLTKKIWVTVKVK